VRRLAILATLMLLTACGGSSRDRDFRPIAGMRDTLASALGGNRGLCGDRRLVGEVVGTVPGELPGCGVEGAVRITMVDDVMLSQPSVMDCQTARALADWVDRGAKRAVGRRGGGLETLHVAAHYVCRTRNHQPGARISEHGKGRAIDITGVTLRNGTNIDVGDDWGRFGQPARILRRMHGSACGPFGTVLGPESDRFHQNHFHFDTARHRGGPYCR
jgi:hypothetical protein